jgi:hypothetical protein
MDGGAAAEPCGGLPLWRIGQGDGLFGWLRPSQYVFARVQETHRPMPGTTWLYQGGGQNRVQPANCRIKLINVAFSYAFYLPNRNNHAKLSNVRGRGRKLWSCDKSEWHSMTNARFQAINTSLNRVCFLILFAFLMPFPANGSSLFYGTVRYRLIQESPFTFDRLYRFTVQVEGCQWAVKLDPIYCKTDNTNDLIVPDYEFATYDGKTVYDVISYMSYTSNFLASSSGNQAARSPVQTIGAQGSLFQEEIPWGVTPVIAHLWLMFGSQCYLQSRGNGTGKIMPFRYAYEATNSTDARTVIPADWELSKGGPFCIEQLVAYSENSKDTSTITITDLLSEVTSTNVAIVTAFNGNNKPFTVTDINVTNNQHGTAATMPFIPPVLRPTITKDYRFALSDPPAAVSFVVENHWPSLSFTHTLYLDRIQSQGRANMHAAIHKRMFFWILFTGMFVLPIIIFAQIKLKTKPDRKE